ncbi:MAG: flavohemoprotein, partial [Ralstonia mannitolilytica]
PNGRTWRISVKRDAGDADRPAGTVSSWLHANAREGQVLLVSRPYGDFVPQLATGNPIVLMSAGVGITPMIATLNTLAQQNSARRVVFGHADRAASHVAHADDLERAAQALPAFEAHVFLESGEAVEFAARPAQPGRMAVDAFLRDDTTDADFYLCGPLPFMQAQRAALLANGVPAERIHREVFGPDLLDDIL